jgi:transposase
MMGTTEKKSGKMFYSFCLNKKIPQDHPLRKLKQILELEFMYDLLKNKYGTNGNVSIPPPILMKLMLLLVFYNVRSERELMKTLPMRLDWLWFLGYDIDDEIPHHSVLSKARKRWGEETFKELFRRVLLQALESGLVDGKKLFADSSLVDADASRNSVEKIHDDRFLDSSYTKFSERLDEKDPEKPSVKKEEKPKKGGYQKINDRHTSKTDPDATLVRAKGDTRLRYKVHRSVDEAHEIITSCKTTTGIVNEASVLGDLVDSHCEVLGHKPEVVIADSKYGIKENYVSLKKQDIKTHMKDLSLSQEEGGQRKEKFSKKDFQYYSEGNYFLCPAGERLNKRSYNPSRELYEYKASKKVCNKCKLRPKCTRSQNGRAVKRHKNEELLEKALADAHSDLAKEDLRKRQHLMERSFGTGTRYGYKRTRWRGLMRASIHQYLVAIVQNLNKITKYGDIGESGNGNKTTLGALTNGFLSIFKPFFNVFNLKLKLYFSFC